jgi:hypothetical protein
MHRRRDKLSNACFCPYELIIKIVKFRVAENIKRAEDKLKKKK